MKRIFVVASHHQLADGMKDTLGFITGKNDNVIALSAYMDNQRVDDQINDLMNQFNDDDEVIILTDLMAGSVNQKFFSYRNKANTHIIAGVNLPLLISLVMEPTNKYLNNDRINELISEARNQIINVNDYTVEDDDEDE